MQLEIKENPENKTIYEPGDLIGYEGINVRYMVVGEDDIYLHTFVIGDGRYWGIYKLRSENLSRLVRKETTRRT